jgi:hypothetical protein
MSIRNVSSLICVILLSCAGCKTAPEKPHPNRAAVDFSGYRTFALLPPSTHASLDKATARAVVEAAENGARDALLKSGYTEADRETADLVFYLHGKAIADVELSELGYVQTLSTFGTDAREVSATSDRRYFVEGYDNHTKRQVWMDWVTCECTMIVPSRIRKEFHQVFEGFPARVETKVASLAQPP